MNSTLSGFYIPDLSEDFDMKYFWKIVANFLSSISPFALIVGAALIVGLVIMFVVRGIRR
ncbi:hypothetical protein SAMN04489725_1169 [Alicyclobacillus hesperidum]|uniref:Uncharacterized protein n=1 Tax=Alicyclobacillus hesperidum TaxID=89784 RepID=A0A1H2WN35_9BACL|nr:hypothetical protein SAMN04489725_1169 [Alicyclobacillus hesperidum]